MIDCHFSFQGLTFSKLVQLDLPIVPKVGDVIYYHPKGGNIKYPSGDYVVESVKLCINQQESAENMKQGIHFFYYIKAKLEKQDDEGMEGGVR